MSDPTQILDAIVSEVDAGRRVAVCVVVATRGSTPQVPGAFICVDEAARIIGTVGGGCSEAEIRRRALELLAASRSPGWHGQTDREAWHGRAQRGHVEPANTGHARTSGPGMPPDDEQHAGEGCHGQAQRRHVASDDEQHAGASGLGMAPDNAGSDDRQHARTCGPGMAPTGPGMAPDRLGMPSDRSGKTPDGHASIGEVVTLEMDHDYGFDDGLICGGQMDVAITLISQPDEALPFREAAVAVRAGKPAILPVRVQSGEGPVEYRVQIEASPKLVIAGGGHVARALATLMVPLGFHITVIDDRSEFANADRFAAPINPVAADIAETLTKWPVDPNTYVVIVTRGHKHDEQALSAVLDSPAKYLGMIGSRRKIQVIFDDLKHAGATQQQLDRVHSPIGLDIKAVTPEEIAVSIAAELIAVRRADHRKVVEGPIMLTDHAT